MTERAPSTKVLTAPEDFGKSWEWFNSEIIDKFEDFCETHSLATEKDPFREPKQTQKFLQRVKAFLEINGLNPNDYDIEIQ